MTDCLQPYYFHIHLVGSEGSLLDNRFHSQKLKTNKNKWSHLEIALVDSGDVSDHPYQPQFQAFVDATKAGEKTRSPISTQPLNRIASSIPQIGRRRKGGRLS